MLPLLVPLSVTKLTVRDVNIDHCFDLLFRRLDPPKRPLIKSTVVFSDQMRWVVAQSISVDRFFLMHREERFPQGPRAPNFAVHLKRSRQLHRSMRVKDVQQWNRLPEDINIDSSFLLFLSLPLEKSLEKSV